LTTTRQRGSHWEQVAENFLRERGLETVVRNYHTRFGEIDLVLRDGNTLVFAEVRYRQNQGHGTGAESVTWTKQQRIIRGARRFLQCHQGESLRPCRVDVVSIGIVEGRPLLNWIRSAFDAG
jgi:putative endonuclease